MLLDISGSSVHTEIWRGLTPFVVFPFTDEDFLGEMLYTSWLLHTTVQFQDHSLRVWGGAEGSSVKACIGEPVQRPHCLIRGSVRGDPLPGGRSLRWTCVWLLVPTWGPFRTSRVLPQDSPLSLSWLPSC